MTPSAFRTHLANPVRLLRWLAFWRAVCSISLIYPWWIAPLRGCLVYAGAGQNTAVSLLAAPSADCCEVFIAMFVANRSGTLFYGLSFCRPISRRRLAQTVI